MADCVHDLVRRQGTWRGPKDLDDSVDVCHARILVSLSTPTLLDSASCSPSVSRSPSCLVCARQLVESRAYPTTLARCTYAVFQSRYT